MTSEQSTMKRTGATSERTLTDADVSAIVDKLKAEIAKDFYGEVGRGVWVWFKKVFFAFLFMLAVYGIAQSRGLSSVLEVQK